jgi:hypothetical protein
MFKVLIVMFNVVVITNVLAAPPLPGHNVEGNSGIFITSTAYFANPPEGDSWLGKPSVSGSFVVIGEKDFESFAITNNLWARVELGYALERIGLGDWPDDVKEATAGTIHVNNHALLHNFNLRYMAIQEGDFEIKWMPALTVGAHFKWNDGLHDIDKQTNGLCGDLGADHSFGTEFTVVASKTITNWLPKPIILSAGVRNGDAIHTGLMGFAGERETTFEGSIIYFLTDKLLLATEYRQKPDLLDQCTLNGKHLIKAENDWWDIALAYILNDRTTLAVGYANFGNILNHHEKNVWAVQIKHEF